MWLKAVVVEEDKKKGGPPKVSRPQQGTPQGGVISPLLANLYLHYFDKKFHSEQGPYQWANARLVRYADDFVIEARYVGHRIRNWVESLLEDRFALTINRDKTRAVRLNEPGATLDFLGYTFRYDRDLYGRDRRYLNMFPSKKAMEREREALREMIRAEVCFKPITELIQEVNRQLIGWSNYFGQGYPRQAFRDLNYFVRSRLIRHLKRRSQRPFRPPKGVTWYAQLHRLGLIDL